MNTWINYALGCLLLFSACSVENDYIFDDISTSRLNQYIDECDRVLLNSKHGWKFIYYPDTTQYGAYTFLMKFSEGKRVMMECDFNEDTTVSSYGYNAAVGPIISFNTYSLLHLLADPNPEVAGGKAGLGYGGEYEFLITDVQTDRISLLGKKERRSAQLVPATAEDWENFPEQRKAIRKFDQFIASGENTPFYHYMRIGTDTAFCYYSPKLRMAYLTYVEDGKTVPLKLPVYSTVNGIHFDREVTFGGQTFSELAFDGEKRAMSIVDDGVEAEFFWAETNTERCRLRFPGAVDIAKAIDGFSLVERGFLLQQGNALDLTPEGHGIEEFRFYWKLSGYCAAELYIRESAGMATYARLIQDTLVTDDQIWFETQNNSSVSGMVNNQTNMWFGLTYAGTKGVLEKFIMDEEAQGLTVIPVGGQFYMIQNKDNRAWAFFTPLVENK